MTYTAWLSQWLNNYVRPSVKIRTYERYSKICALHIIPTLGNIPLDKITAIDLQSLVTALLTSGNNKNGKSLSANSVNTVISVIKNSLKTARLLGLTSQYVADKIRRPKTMEKQVDCFTLCEQKKIEKYVLNHKKDKLFGIILSLYTGLRIGELLALTWNDIDFQKSMLSVTKTCYDGTQNGTHARIIDTPKTPHSRRIIPIPKQLLPLLKSLKKRSKCNYVIADGTKPVFVRSYQRTFELLLKKLGIAHKGFHSLRHTFATRALECGMDVRTLSELLGHKNPTITLTRYAHSLLDHKTDMMNRLGKLL